LVDDFIASSNHSVNNVWCYVKGAALKMQDWTSMDLKQLLIGQLSASAEHSTRVSHRIYGRPM